MVFAALAGAMAVALGAAGAHWLQGNMDTSSIARIEKAATYQMYHALALLAVVLMHRQWPRRGLRIVAWLMALGIMCFSGSLVLYSFTAMHWLVFITPIGGVAWIGAWLYMAYFFCIARNTYES